MKRLHVLRRHAAGLDPEGSEPGDVHFSGQTDWLSEFDRVQREIHHRYWEAMLEIEREKNTAPELVTRSRKS